MQNLLKIEWLKIKNYRTFWILAVLFVISVVGVNYFAYQIKQATMQNNQQVNALVGAPFDFPNVWHTVSYLSSFLLFILGLMIITSVCNEFTFKTHRQNVIDGWSRTQFINVKIVMVLILALCASVVVFFTALLFGAFSGSGFNFSKIEFIGYYFIQAFSYGMVALLLSVLIKRSGLALGVFFLYSFIIENAFGAILNYFAARLNYGAVSARSIYGPGDYLPLNTTDNLIPFPFFRNIIKLGDGPSIYVLLGLSACYLALYYFLTVKKFLKDDL